MNKEIEQQIHEFAVQRYKARYEYQRGLNDAWRAARKIVRREDDIRSCFNDIAPSKIILDYSASEAITLIKKYEENQKQTIHNCTTCKYGSKKGNTIGITTISRCHNPNVSVVEFTEGEDANCEYYAEDDEIKVGDEVICFGTDCKKIVFSIKRDKDNVFYSCFNEENGVSCESDKDGKPIKTGRHFPQIAEALKQMKGAEK